MKSKQKKSETVSVATNRKARHRYNILETFEAGLVLRGSEVKSVRQGKISIAESFARLQNEEAYLFNAHIAPYDHASTHEELDSRRTRKLLLHKAEIRRLFGKTQQKGWTLIPLEVYFKRGVAKVLIGLGTGKTGPDRREDIRRRETEREMRRAFSGRHKI